MSAATFAAHHQAVAKEGAFLNESIAKGYGLDETPTILHAHQSRR